MTRGFTFVMGAITVAVVITCVGIGYATIVFLGPGLPTGIGSAEPPVSPLVVSPLALVIAGVVFFGGLTFVYWPLPRKSTFAEFWEAVEK